MSATCYSVSWRWPAKQDLSKGPKYPWYKLPTAIIGMVLTTRVPPYFSNWTLWHTWPRKQQCHRTGKPLLALATGAMLKPTRTLFFRFGFLFRNPMCHYLQNNPCFCRRTRTQDEQNEVWVHQAVHVGSHPTPFFGLPFFGLGPHNHSGWVGTNKPACNMQ